MLGKGRGGLYKAPTKEEKGKPVPRFLKCCECDCIVSYRGFLIKKMSEMFIDFMKYITNGLGVGAADAFLVMRASHICGHAIFDKILELFLQQSRELGTIFNSERSRDWRQGSETFHREANYLEVVPAFLFRRSYFYCESRSERSHCRRSSYLITLNLVHPLTR